MTTHAQPTRHPGRRTRRLLGLAAAISMTAVAGRLLLLRRRPDASEGSAGASAASSASRAPGEDGGGPGTRPAAGRTARPPRTGVSGATTSSTGAARAPVAVERHVISHGTVSLTSDDVREARRDVQRVVDASGGDVTEEQTDTATRTARPSTRDWWCGCRRARFGDAMTALEGVADLRGSDRTSEDVSTQVIDTDVRVRAQEASLQRVEQLLARAQGLKDIIWIESQLTTRQAELDSLKGQQAWLADQTRDSTIVVDISRTPDEEPQEEEDATGFLAGLTGGMKALGAVAVGAGHHRGRPAALRRRAGPARDPGVARRTPLVRRRRPPATPPAAA